ncbi:hypothetical protein JF66_09010 [Cryobacterium sp. MLB-32]|uniref:glycoside hydrolase family 3 protein n=1 Tax=Cryobacterium sp. MLB-32 TaxID=1529318 RepID=UPI0004E77409|nr:glycoside hydrolase family 3 N-terminal domain-containing protein [Cryobacterium sp. MLB-32]KFF59763.1 hypothetical protein JF66_09010 [Cryobacterium sp. MLB-32]
MTVDPAALRLVNGVLWPGFSGRTVPDWLAHALDDGLAGVVYFGQNIDEADTDQPARLSRAIRGIRSNALIGIDEEGGTVTRLEALRGSRFASHAQLGRLDDLDATRRTGRMIGAQAAAAGATVVLAPVADVNTNPANPVIGVRSFGSDTALVARNVAAMVRGLAESGVAACVKHFPGHGDTHTDSHLALPRLNLSWAEVQRDHLPPFVAAIDAGVRAVMTAHIVLPHFGELPATLNPRVLGLLREIGFEGAIVTDALDMAAIRSTFGAGPGAVRALLAGADLLCIGNPSNLGPNQGRTTDEEDYLEVRNSLLAALDDGSITAATLEAAGERTAELARPAANTTTPGTGWSTDAPARVDDSAPGIDAAENDAAQTDAEGSRRIVRAAIAVRGELCPLPRALTVIDVRDRPSFAEGPRPDVFSTELALAFELTRVVTGSAPATALDAARAVPVGNALVVLADRLAVPGPQSDAVHALAALRSDLVTVNAGLAARAGSGTVIDCFGGSLVTAQVVRELLEGVVPA